MLRFKSCPRCRGDVLIERDQYGWYEYCIQCGYQRDLKWIHKEQGQVVLDVQEVPKGR